MRTLPTETPTAIYVEVKMSRKRKEEIIPVHELAVVKGKAEGCPRRTLLGEAGDSVGTSHEPFSLARFRSSV